MTIIERDNFGVPIISVDNMLEAIYKIAQAHCQDDFFTIQTWLLAVHKMAGRYDDWDGPYLDFLCEFFCIQYHAKNIQNLISPEYIEMIDEYVKSINDFASNHHDDVLNPKIFPISRIDIISVHHLMEIIGIQLDKPYSYLKNGQHNSKIPHKEGSVAIAISSAKSMSGGSLLALSPHQMLEGIYSFYEIDVTIKKDDMRLHGFILPCTFTIFMGTNSKIGWGSTASYPDMYNIYKIDQINKEKGKYFLIDKERKYELKENKYFNYFKYYSILPIPILKKYFTSPIGSIIKIDGSFYLIEIPMLGRVLGTEMNFKLTFCKSCEEAERLLKSSHYPYLDFVLADSQGKILYYHNTYEKKQGKQENHFSDILPFSDFEDIDTVGFYENNALYISNPKSGYIVSANQSPFNITEGVEITPHAYKGLVYRNENSRSKRIKQLLSAIGKITVEDLQPILFDTKIEMPIIRGIDFSNLYKLEPNPTTEKINRLIMVLKEWDGTASLKSEGAAIFALLFYIFHKQHYVYSKNPDIIRIATIDEITQSLYWVRKFYKDGETLENIQFLKRESYEVPIEGIPDSINTVRPYFSKGKLYAEEASAFRMIIDLKNSIVYTCHPFGASANNESDHFTDQSELFISNKYKIYNLNK